MKDAQRARFYSQLARLLESGMAPAQSLAMLGDEGTALSKRLQGSQSLALAWQAEKGFSETEHWVVEAGEESGELAVCFESLADHFERQDRIKKKMIAKLVYPAFLLHAVFLLPALGLLLTAGWAAYLRLAVLPLVAIWTLILAGKWLFGRIRSSATGAFAIDRFLLRLPLVGAIVKDRSLALYSGSLALLIGAGLPLLASLDRAARIVPNRWIRRMAERVTSEVRKGSSIAESMDGSFPSAFVEMVRVGEMSGQLEEQLRAASRFLDEEGQTSVTRLVTVTSFLTFLLVAIVVGAVVIRSWLAIVGL